MIKKNSKKRVIVYGAGRWAQARVTEIKENYEVLFWVDKNYETIDVIGEFKVNSPDLLRDCNEYDELLICVKKKEQIAEIKNTLIQKYGVPTSKIVVEQVRTQRMLKYKTVFQVIDECFDVKEVQDGGKKINDKIKVRVLLLEYGHVWNALKSVCLAFMEDERVELRVVLRAHLREQDDQKSLDFIKKDIINGQVVLSKNYDMAEDAPDIVVTGLFIENDKNLNLLLSKYAKYVAQIPFVLLKTQRDIRGQVKRTVENMENGNISCSIYDKLVYDEMDKCGVLDKRFVCIGNPKFDEIFHRVNSDISYPFGWEKLQHRKVVLWTTDHVWLGDNVTFDSYYKHFFSFFNQNKDMGLIFRPHPRLMMEIQEEGIWTVEEWNAFKSAINETENMIYDDLMDYSTAYKLSDAIITDANCGIIVSALPLGKPLGVLFRPDTPVEPMYPQIIDKLYRMGNEKELFGFFEMVRNGEDPKKKDREYAMEKSIAYFDGKNGERIKEYLLKDYERKCEVNKQ